LFGDKVQKCEFDQPPFAQLLAIWLTPQNRNEQKQIGKTSSFKAGRSAYPLDTEAYKVLIHPYFCVFLLTVFSML